MMHTVIKRLLFFIASFTLTLGASLASMPDGGALTLSQIGDVSLVSWLMAVGSGALGALDAKAVTKGAK